MPQQDNPALSYPAGTGITRWRLGKHNTTDDTVDLCGATDLPIGILMDDVDAGAIQGIRMFSAGKAEGVAAVNNVAMGQRLYTAANGKLTNVPVDGCFLVGFALQASTADGDVIDFLPLPVPLPIQDMAALTVAAVAAGTVNSGDATTDTVIESLRTQLTALIADVTAIRADLVASKQFLT